MARSVLTLDFETESIKTRPSYPPKPVGVALRLPGKKSKYLSWGHPVENNTTEDAARAEVTDLMKKHTVVCHNGKYDLDVAETHWKIPMPSYDRWEDTMILAYLNDPHARSLELKTLAPAMLGTPATGRDELREWVLKNVREAKPSDWGAYIRRAPGQLVGRYACGDTDMTHGLLGALHLAVVDQGGMREAYEREKKIIPVLLDSERHGMKVDINLLKRDIDSYSVILDRLDDWIRKTLKSPSLNIASGKELADALERSGKASEFRLTPTGKRSTSKESLNEAIADPMLKLALDYRSTLANYLNNFMVNWYEQAVQTGGRIYTKWHSTKQEEDNGSRTGRLSSTPNWQNIPSLDKRGDINNHLAKLLKKLPWLLPLPNLRAYILPDDGCILLDRDYSQQEPRVLGHFEDGLLCEAYNLNPNLDIYKFIIEKVLELMGMDLVKVFGGFKEARNAAKQIVLSVMYGVGTGLLAIRLNMSMGEAKEIKNAVLRAFPGIKNLTNDLKSLGKAGLPMRTWGGRVYYAEPPKIINGQMREFGYKLINYLIQGSSADITKEAAIRYYSRRKNGRMMANIHDELLACAKIKAAKSEMKILQECMEGIELDVPLTSSGAFGDNWGNLKEAA